MNLPGSAFPLLSFLLAAGAAVLLILAGVHLIRFFFLVLGRILRFLKREVRDLFQLAGNLVSAAILLPLVLLNLLADHPSRLAHYRRAVLFELRDAGLCVYRLLLRNPLALVGGEGLIGHFERHLTEVVRHAPAEDLKGKDRGMFAGYRVVGSLPTGGSGARLFIAEPRPDKAAALAAAGFPAVRRVVIKSFALQDGPSLPQIVRESRALEAARRLGLVLEHGLDERHFFYVMPYVPGENLSTVIDRLHAQSGGEGLPTPQLRKVLSYASDLLLTLERYHQGGLWHKDVKPDNLVVCGERAYLVDLGLVTPLASAMTLTTHGTEYFRDPELVRMAMRGAKVNEVDGVRFDLYGAGAVLFTMVEGSFPAHGGLSRITRRCPEAVKWIVRRAMAEISGRYSSAREMLLDLHAVLAAEDPFALKPADLPSLGGPRPAHLPAEPPPLREFRTGPSVAACASAAAPPPPPVPATAPGRRRRRRRPLAVAVAAVVGAVVAVGIVRDQSLEWEARRHLAALEAEEAIARATAEASVPRGGSEPGFALTVTHVLASPGAAPEADESRILILDDLTNAGRSGSGELAARARARLAEGGFLLCGEIPGGSAAEAEIDLLAGARNAVGLLDPVDAVAELGAFLASRPGAPAAAVWLRPGQSEGSAECLLVCTRGETLAGRIAAALGID
ncbi:MAG: hypothetical protein D6702_06505 [Planctomycetota bacterium]|nr:MAG: hypothetical protein D6702_06505 [Planctomycetota bacterium]